MDHRPQSPELAVEEAKARLLGAARDAEPLAALRRRPWIAVAGAAASGFFLGKEGFRLLPLLFRGARLLLMLHPDLGLSRRTRPQGTRRTPSSRCSDPP